jgi:hypothetical protein
MVTASANPQGRASNIWYHNVDDNRNCDDRNVKAAMHSIVEVENAIIAHALRKIICQSSVRILSLPSHLQAGEVVQVTLSHVAHKVPCDVPAQ